MADETTGTETATAGESTGTGDVSHETTTTGSEHVEKTTTDGTTTTTGTETQKEPEFADENMQKAWTEKTQKLADERKAFESLQTEFEGRRSEYEKKAALFDKFDSDPEIVKFIRNRFGVEEEKPAISSEEMLEAQADPAKFAALVQREAKKLVSPVAERMGNLELENSIQSYSDTKGNEDFWELYDAGLIRDKMVALRNSNPKISDLELVKNSHLEARKIMNAVNARAEQLAKDKAAGIVAQKKDAIMDRGGRSSSAGGGGKSYKGKSITDVANDILSATK